MNLQLRAIKAILKANEKATKMIDADLEPPIEQDELQDVLLGMLERDMAEEQAGLFVWDLFANRELNAEQIYNKYFNGNQ